MKRLIAAILTVMTGFTASAQNPFLPLWEHLADIEAKVFEDPDLPGHQRIYIFGTHDTRLTAGGGTDIHCWSAPTEDLSEWKDEGPVFTHFNNGRWNLLESPEVREVIADDGHREYFLYARIQEGSGAMVIGRGARPDGPFTPVNLNADAAAGAQPAYKVGDKYVSVYGSESTLRYKFADTPEGPWKSGGILIDGYVCEDAHGSLLDIGGQWYVFYHRSPRGSGFARQTMVSPVSVQYDDIPVAAGGEVRISGAEVTSEGFSTDGLDPFRYYSAGYACFLSRPESQQDSWDIWRNEMDITGVRPGDIIGYRYFDCNPLKGKNNLEFNLFLTPLTGRAFKVAVWLDSPYDDGLRLGEIEVPEGSARKAARFSFSLGKILSKTGMKHAVYLVAEGDGPEPMFNLHGLGFSRKNAPIERIESPEVVIKVGDMVLDIPKIPAGATEENGYTGSTIYDIPFIFPSQGMSKIEATASLPETKVELILPERGSNITTVRYEWNGKVKTYRLIY